MKGWGVWDFGFRVGGFGFEVWGGVCISLPALVAKPTYPAPHTVSVLFLFFYITLKTGHAIPSSVPVKLGSSKICSAVYVDRRLICTRCLAFESNHDDPGFSRTRLGYRGTSLIRECAPLRTLH